MNALFSYRGLQTRCSGLGSGAFVTAAISLRFQLSDLAVSFGRGVHLAMVSSAASSTTVSVPVSSLGDYGWPFWRRGNLEQWWKCWVCQTWNSFRRGRVVYEYESCGQHIDPHTETEWRVLPVKYRIVPPGTYGSHVCWACTLSSMSGLSKLFDEGEVTMHICWICFEESGKTDVLSAIIEMQGIGLAHQLGQTGYQCCIQEVLDGEETEPEPPPPFEMPVGWDPTTVVFD